MTGAEAVRLARTWDHTDPFPAEALAALVTEVDTLRGHREMLRHDLADCRIALIAARGAAAPAAGGWLT